MTIHSDWAKAIKMRYPTCFRQSLPLDPVAHNGIIDGHIQLMGAYHVTSWDQFLSSQFLRPITQLFSGGCTTVVLLFDNRMAVSPYKGMTQFKRCKRYQEVQFSNTDPLPEKIPEQWLDFMMNRNFKDRVISFVCERIQALIKPDDSRTLIVDFKGPPKMYTHPTACPHDILELTELGESDIKFVRYVQMLGNSIVHATDGDYIPISLLYYSVHGVRDDNHILIYRQEANIGGAKDAEAKKKPPKRRMEYISMQPVFNSIQHVCRSPELNDYNENAKMVAFVTMMLLAGTDYSRCIPLVGPKRLIDIVPDIKMQMMNSISIPSPDHDPTTPAHSALPVQMTNQLVTAIYRSIFSNYLQTKTYDDITELLTNLSHSKLSERSKNLLPTPAQVDVTCRNVTWVIHYWKDCINTTPDVTQPDLYGFSYDPKLRQYTWSDLVGQMPDPAPTKDDIAEESTKKPEKRKQPDETPIVTPPTDPTIQLVAHTDKQVQRLKNAALFIASTRPQQAPMPALPKPRTVVSVFFAKTKPPP